MEDIKTFKVYCNSWENKAFTGPQIIIPSSLFLFQPYLVVQRSGETCIKVADMHASEKAIRTINNAGYRDHTNPVFIKFNTLNLMVLVQFKPAQIPFKAKNNLLPKKSRECSQTEGD